MYKFLGLDSHGIPKVTGVAHDSDVAEAKCVGAIRDHICANPQSGPFELWSVKNVTWRADDPAKACR